jgi:hypothetical protein
MIMQRARATQFHAPIARCCEAGIDTLNYRVPFKFRDSDATRARPARRVRAPARARARFPARNWWCRVDRPESTVSTQ